MPKTVSATEGKTRFAALVEAAAAEGQEVIVESHGRPRAAIIGYDAYREFMALREEARRREVLDQLRRLRERVRSRNEDLDDDRAEALADRLTRDAFSEMAREGRITLEEE
jgi:prevent-host-death family protein